MYKITEKCPRKIIIQSLPSGDYDYSDCASLEGAWEAEKSERWVQEHAEQDGCSIDSAKADFMATISEYSQDEALAAAKDGYTWPLEMGFVDEE